MTFPKEAERSLNGCPTPAFEGQEAFRAEVLRSVDAIIASGVLGKGDRRASLLQYLVDKELSGEGNNLKAFTIAMDVLGRDASFDPNTDSIVRSEVGRLRDALTLYFAGMAEAGDVRIEIPKGTYRPVLLAPETQPSFQPAPRFKWAAVGVGIAALLAVLAFGYTVQLSGPNEVLEDRQPISELPYDLVRIAVVPFSGSGDNPDAAELAFGIFSELSTSLSAYPWISVVSPVEKAGGLDSGQVDYVLIGDVHWNGGSLQTSARLVNAQNEQLIWGDSQTLMAEPEAIRKSVLAVSSRIAFDLGSRHGIASELVKVQTKDSSPENLAAFICFLGSYTYIAAPTDVGHLELRTCLTRAVAEFPAFGDGWAALALAYIDEARFGLNRRAGANPWQDAKEALDHALKHAPLRMPTLNVALIWSIESPEPDREAFERYASLLLRLYPRHPGTLNNVGSRMAEFTGQWDRGLALIDEAIYLDPQPPSAFFVTQAYRAAVSGDDDAVQASVARLSATTSVSQLLLKYLAAARGASITDMRALRSLMAAQGLMSDDDILSHVLNRRYSKEIETALLDQLGRAFSLEASQ